MGPCRTTATFTVFVDFPWKVRFQGTSKGAADRPKEGLLAAGGTTIFRLPGICAAHQQDPGLMWQSVAVLSRPRPKTPRTFLSTPLLLLIRCTRYLLPRLQNLIEESRRKKTAHPVVGSGACGVKPFSKATSAIAATL